MTNFDDVIDYYDLEYDPQGLVCNVASWGLILVVPIDPPLPEKDAIAYLHEAVANPSPELILLHADIEMESSGNSDELRDWWRKMADHWPHIDMNPMREEFYKRHPRLA